MKNETIETRFKLKYSNEILISEKQEASKIFSAKPEMTIKAK